MIIVKLFFRDSWYIYCFLRILYYHRVIHRRVFLYRHLYVSFLLKMISWLAYIRDVRTYWFLQIGVSRIYGLQYPLQVKWGLMTSRRVRRLHLRKVHDDSHGALHGVHRCNRLMSSLTMQYFQVKIIMPLLSIIKRISLLLRFITSHVGCTNMKYKINHVTHERISLPAIIRID